ncbi:agamous-like MADS-box protein AGL61 [Lolium perenne]|uniref:agamous-like MADS-box protein AGL61 n=1 Tax=Lolium perenne TaxID=4522 RepID=UPI0021F64EC4|nr:agamous-like MADS-box protein AGL61 [Lolium perenne]
MARRRTSMGRQKIEIRRIESEEARQVCFSKRRAGLFKKASELAILCGAEVAAVVFSPAGKAFSFGHPSVEAILERFAPTGVAAGGGVSGAGEDNKQLVELNRQYGELRAQLDAEKARKERVEEAMAKQRAEASPVAAWLEADVRDMGEEELMAFAAALAEVQAAVAARANQVLQDALNHGHAMAARARSNMVPLPAPQQHFLAMGVGADNGGFEFGRSTNGGANNDGAGIEMQMQIQQMMMAMPPPSPGFAGAGMEMMMQQGFGFLGPY